MPFETENRLKSYLDSNQLHREQMCLAILSIDKRFTNVLPRHPRGGPDGGRDIEAIYNNAQKVFGAVGFINQANDSGEQKRAIKRKFNDDLQNILSAAVKPSGFVFFTNIALTIAEKDELIGVSRQGGLEFCEIFDRERLRIALDNTDGFAIRFQYLNLTLSEAEQASFFAKWGGDIQSVISTGFQRVEETLNRVLFLQEATATLSNFAINFELDRTYEADEIGHFRAFCFIQLKEPKLGIFEILFGSSDKSGRMHPKRDASNQPVGIKHGISGAQWERSFDPEVEDAFGAKNENAKLPEFVQKNSSSGIGLERVSAISIGYTHDHGLVRYEPRLILRDIDEAVFMPVLNKSLAKKIKSIRAYANGYKVLEISHSDFHIDEELFEAGIPNFIEDELADQWIRIRPTSASIFRISFSDRTPKRLFSPHQI